MRFDTTTSYCWVLFIFFVFFCIFFCTFFLRKRINAQEQKYAKESRYECFYAWVHVGKYPCTPAPGAPRLASLRTCRPWTNDVTRQVFSGRGEGREDVVISRRNPDGGENIKRKYHNIIGAIIIDKTVCSYFDSSRSLNAIRYKTPNTRYKPEADPEIIRKRDNIQKKEKKSHQPSW